MSCHVFVDFDGTIALRDSTNDILSRFADPSWLEVEEDWVQGRIGSRECMERQIELLRATPADLDAFVASIEIDPAFHGFVRLCRKHGASMTVVSDGLDRVVGSVLKSAGLELPHFANRLEWQGGDRWRLRFPYARSDCRSRMGNCKCAHRRPIAAALEIMVGDGRSDFCIAERAHLVLAKGRLAEYCRDQELPHVAFDSFTDANQVVAGWFSAQAKSRAKAAEAFGDDR